MVTLSRLLVYWNGGAGMVRPFTENGSHVDSSLYVLLFGCSLLRLATS